MYRNLNQFSKSNIDLKYNNSSQLDYVSKQLNTSITFSYSDLNLKKELIVYNRQLKNCVVKCPDGEIWTSLDYTIYAKTEQQQQRTVFDFSYVNDDQWNKDELYYIYPGTPDKGVSLYNSTADAGVQLLHIKGQDYILKKLHPGNGISISFNDTQIKISTGQNNIFSLPKSLDQDGVIDLYYGDLQFYYTYNDSQIVDLKDSFFSVTDESSSSTSSGSSFGLQVQSITIMLYKPNATILKYKNNIILNRYDVGWFAFGIKKVFDSLFIGQPSRIITDYKI